MDAINFDHSIKDIPVPHHKVYLNMFISSLETFFGKAVWRLMKHLYPEKFQTSKNKFGFPSLKNTLHLKELVTFKADLIDLTKSIQFRRNYSAFQNQLKS